MNPIEYKNLIKKWFWFQLLISIAMFVVIVVLLNPNANQLYIWAFMIDSVVVIFSILAIISLTFFEKKKDRTLTIANTNQIIYQSLISSSVIITIMVLGQTNNLNILSFGLVIFCYVLYQIWINSEDS